MNRAAEGDRKIEEKREPLEGLNYLNPVHSHIYVKSGPLHVSMRERERLLLSEL